MAEKPGERKEKKKPIAGAADVQRAETLGMLSGIKEAADKALQGIKGGTVKLVPESEDEFVYPEPLNKDAIEMFRTKRGETDIIGFSLPEEQAGELRVKLKKEIAADDSLRRTVRNEASDWKDRFVVDRNKDDVEKLITVFSEFLPERIVAELRKLVE